MFANALKVLGLLIVLAVGLVFLLPPITRGREAARRTQCKNNLKWIMLALHNYHDTYNCFPPAYTTDRTGNPLHSWRTLLLPYLDQGPVYESIDLSKAWDDPANIEARKTILSVFCCPATHLLPKNVSVEGSLTTYLAVVTEHSCLRPNSSHTLEEISDGSGNTLMILEVAPEQAVHWMQPTDADEQMVLTLGKDLKRPHVGGTHGALADGSIRFLSINTSEQVLRAIISIDGHESVEAF